MSCSSAILLILCTTAKAFGQFCSTIGTTATISERKMIPHMLSPLDDDVSHSHKSATTPSRTRPVSPVPSSSRRQLKAVAFREPLVTSVRAIPQRTYFEKRAMYYSEDEKLSFTRRHRMEQELEEARLQDEMRTGDSYFTLDTRADERKLVPIVPSDGPWESPYIFPDHLEMFDFFPLSAP